MEQEILFGRSLYYQKNAKIQTGFLKKKKNERFNDKDLSFFFKTIILSNAISLTIWLNLHTTVDPSSTLQWKEKEKKRRNCSVFCFVWPHSLHCLEPIAPIDYKTHKIKKKKQLSD